MKNELEKKMSEEVTELERILFDGKPEDMHSAFFGMMTEMRNGVYNEENAEKLKANVRKFVEHYKNVEGFPKEDIAYYIDAITMADARSRDDRLSEESQNKFAHLTMDIEDIFREFLD